jgi:23S rRNA (adenine2030-N6)-methyltransferase
MLSYQHAYHAANLADVHKHALLAWVLDYLTRKDKPFSYIETHAGRALYDLGSEEALKTGEASMGFDRVQSWFSPDHPYLRSQDQIRALHGPRAYAGSPLIAAQLTRAQDSITLAELHPQESAALRRALPRAKVHRQDGFDLAHSLLPPTPRRGVLLVDPSYEVKSDYDTLPRHFAKWHKAWNVGILMLWYPILSRPAHQAMLNALMKLPGAQRFEVAFPPAKKDHGMVGSGIFALNPPFGLEEEAARLKNMFGQLRG